MPKFISALRPIHPFPARMAPSIALRRLSRAKKALRILDPMLGSGTTAVVARMKGHTAIGFDTDPLALLIAKSWVSNLTPQRLRSVAKRVLADGKTKYQTLKVGDAYPQGADSETKDFVRFWFDSTNRRQLAALAKSISQVKNSAERTLLWCAFSRLIITKKIGVSLAMDVSHSRPHKKYDIAPVKPFDRFLASVETILKRSPFSSEHKRPKARIRKGDARRLPLENSSIDLVITSPPYLNAIDYLRGHKLSLVWMGHRIPKIRELRSQNCLRHILYWAVDEGFISENPLTRLKLEKPRRKKRPVMSLVEEEKLLHASAPHLRRINIWSLYTGMRRGEILNQEGKDIDLARRVIVVTRSKTAGGESREIPMTQRVFDLLSEKPLPEGLIFTYQDKPIHQIKTAWKAAVRRAGIRPFRFKDLRATFNSRLIEAGVIKDVRKELMGHSRNEDTNDLYSHIELPILREAIEKLEQWVEKQKRKEEPKPAGGTSPPHAQMQSLGDEPPLTNEKWQEAKHLRIN